MTPVGAEATGGGRDIHLFVLREQAHTRLATGDLADIHIFV